MRNIPEFEESDEDEDVKAVGFKNLVLRNTNGAANPLNRGEQAAKSGRRAGSKRVLAEVKATSIIHGGVERLSLEYGEERENQEGQAYVNGGRNKQALCFHIWWWTARSGEREEARRHNAKIPVCVVGVQRRICMR